MSERTQETNAHPLPLFAIACSAEPTDHPDGNYVDEGDCVDTHTPSTRNTTELVATYRVSYRGLEQHEELVHLHCVGIEGVEPFRAECSPLSSLAADDDPRTLEVSPKVETRLDEIHRVAQTVVENDVLKREGDARRMLSDEIHRLTTYFGALLAQNEGDETQRASLAKELDKRVADEVSNFAFEVDVQIVNVAAAETQVVEFRDNETGAVDAVFLCAHKEWFYPDQDVCS